MTRDIYRSGLRRNIYHQFQGEHLAERNCSQEKFLSAAKQYLSLPVA
jgi:hypothetical protein